MKRISLSILSLFFLSSNVFASELETKKVISTGSALTESDALKDTTRNAVLQVVGAYILSETYVKNSQIIKDEILTNSNGYIKSFKILSKSKDENGIIKIEAEVEVEPNNVTKKLGELNIDLKDVATTELKAISLDKFQSSKDFKQMLYEVVFKPIIENKKIYNIRIKKLESVNSFPTYFHYYISSNQEQEQKIKSGESLPFILYFSISFNKDYINSVKSFIKTISTEYYSNNMYYEEGSLDESLLSFSSTSKSDRFKFIEAYKLNDNLIKIYQTSLKSFFLNNKSQLILKFLNEYGKLYKKNIISYGSFNTEIPSSYFHINKENVFYKFGFDSCYNFQHRASFCRGEGLTIIDEIADVELGLYLTEEDISIIKSTSIEIKWSKNEQN